MSPVESKKIEELQEKIFELQDDVIALQATVSALALTLHELNIPVRAGLLHNMNIAANQLEIDRQFPEPAAAIDLLRAVLSELLREGPTKQEQS